MTCEGRGRGYRIGRSGAADAGWWTITRASVTGHLLNLGALALVSAAAYLCIGVVPAQQAPVERTYQALAALSQLRGQLDGAQRGAQGFALTADEHYLQPYTEAAVQVPGTLAELRRRIGTDGAHRTTIDALEASATGALEEIGRTVTLLRTEGFTAARPVVLGTAATEMLAHARQQLDTLHQEQTAVLRADQQRVADQTASTVGTATAAVAIAAVLLAWKRWWITPSATRPVAAGPATTGAPAIQTRVDGLSATAVDVTEPAQTDEAWHAPLRVLLAEDDQVNQQVAQFMLSKLGHRVDTVANGLEAVQALRTTHYDVVLMDVQMPVLDGLEATRLIRADFPADRQPHIIAMTASVLIEDRTACRAAGMNDYLPKPVRLPDLTAALTPLLHLAGTDEQSSGAPSAASIIAATSMRDGSDRDAAVRARLADISDGEPTGPEAELLARLLTSFISKTPAGIDELAARTTAGDVTAVQYHAHALKGAATNIGATALAHLLEEVEAEARVGRLPSNANMIAAIRAEYDLTVPVCEDIADQLVASASR